MGLDVKKLFAGEQENGHEADDSAIKLGARVHGNDEPRANITGEELKRLVAFFDLLLKIDKRINVTGMWGRKLQKLEDHDKLGQF